MSYVEFSFQMRIPCNRHSYVMKGIIYTIFEIYHGGCLCMDGLHEKRDNLNQMPDHAPRTSHTSLVSSTSVTGQLGLTGSF